MNYVKLEEKYKKLEEELNEMNKTLAKVPEEIKKREDTILDIKFYYEWFNLYGLGYNFCINPNFDDFIWSIQQPKIKYQNYHTI